MMLVVLALVLLGVVLGGAGMKAVGRTARGLTGQWRPGTAALSAICLFGGAAMALHADWWQALGLFGLGAALAVGSKRPARAATRPGPAQMGAAEAASMLGVAPDADAAAVREAYRRLIKRVHPDQGGALGLAAQLNAARDAMLKRRP